jgi:protein-disulfide isomerase
LRNLWIGGGIAAVAVVAVIAYLVLGQSPQQTSSETAPTATAESAPAESTGSTSEPAAPAASEASSQQAAAAPEAPKVQAEIYPDDRILGSADAPVTIIEYASMTCPHCARFAAETMPKIKSEFIETGKARLVFRDFPLDKVALSATRLAHCVQGEAYFNLLDVLFRSQKDWAQASDPELALRQIGRTAGIEEAAMDSCLNDQAELDRIVARYKEANEKFQVNSTPTFIINGEVHAGGLPFDDYEVDGKMQPGFATLIKGFLPAP